LKRGKVLGRGNGLNHLPYSSHARNQGSAKTVSLREGTQRKRGNRVGPWEAEGGPEKGKKSETCTMRKE